MLKNQLDESTPLVIGVVLLARFPTAPLRTHPAQGDGRGPRLAVLLDAFFVRLVLLPVLLRLTG